MTYTEALMALERAQSYSWQYSDLSIHDGITQAIQVFKRIRMDLEALQQKDSVDAGKCTCWYDGCICEFRDKNDLCNC